MKGVRMRSFEDDKLKKRNILQLSETVGILHVLSTGPDLSKINWASGVLRHGSQRSLKYLICIFENQIIPCFTIFRIMYLFKTL